MDDGLGHELPRGLLDALGHGHGHTGAAPVAHAVAGEQQGAHNFDSTAGSASSQVGPPRRSSVFAPAERDLVGFADLGAAGSESVSDGADLHVPLADSITHLLHKQVSSLTELPKFNATDSGFS